jgi:hypothetical protein
MSSTPPSPPTQVYNITGVQTSLTEDQSGRTRKYLFSMILRTLCFVGAVIASGWLRWVLIAGAVFLPYIAVVIANAGRENLRIVRRSNTPDNRTLGS